MEGPMDAGYVSFPGPKKGTTPLILLSQQMDLDRPDDHVGMGPVQE